MTMDNLSFDQERELGKLLAAANLQRMRGQWAEAEETCRNALRIAPKDIVFNEMLGDILHECGKLDQALEQYKTALSLVPGKPSLETKHAKVALEIGERERARALAEDMILNPKKYTRREKKPMVALICSFFVPGLGQLYNEQPAKAGVIFGAFLVFLIAFRLLQVYPRGMGSIAELLNLTHPLVLIVGILAFAAYIYGLIDAPMVADKSNKAHDEARKQTEPQ